MKFSKVCVLITLTICLASVYSNDTKTSVPSEKSKTGSVNAETLQMISPFEEASAVPKDYYKKIHVLIGLGSKLLYQKAKTFDITLDSVASYAKGNNHFEEIVSVVNKDSSSEKLPKLTKISFDVTEDPISFKAEEQDVKYQEVKDFEFKVEEEKKEKSEKKEESEKKKETEKKENSENKEETKKKEETEKKEKSEKSKPSGGLRFLRGDSENKKEEKNEEKKEEKKEEKREEERKMKNFDNGLDNSLFHLSQFEDILDTYSENSKKLMNYMLKDKKFSLCHKYNVNINDEHYIICGEKIKQKKSEEENKNKNENENENEKEKEKEKETETENKKENKNQKENEEKNKEKKPSGNQRRLFDPWNSFEEEDNDNKSKFDWADLEKIFTNEDESGLLDKLKKEEDKKESKEGENDQEDNKDQKDNKDQEDHKDQEHNNNKKEHKEHNDNEENEDHEGSDDDKSNSKHKKEHKKDEKNEDQEGHDDDKHSHEDWKKYDLNDLKNYFPDNEKIEEELQEELAFIDSQKKGMNSQYYIFWQKADGKLKFVKFLFN